MAATKAPAIDNLSAKENEVQKITGFPQPGTSDSAGYALCFTASGTTATATAGAATLPATPSGFIECISPTGTVIKVPYYDA